MRTQAEVVHAFTPVGKLDPGLTQRILRIEVAFRELAVELVDLVPECPDRTAALRKLLESKMTCVQAISHAQAEEKAPAPTKEKKDDGKEKK